jgi:hypothetical protein
MLSSALVWLSAVFCESVKIVLSALVQLSAVIPESTQMRSSALEQLSAVFPELATNALECVRAALSGVP